MAQACSSMPGDQGQDSERTRGAVRVVQLSGDDWWEQKQWIPLRLRAGGICSSRTSQEMLTQQLALVGEHRCFRRGDMRTSSRKSAARSTGRGKRRAARCQRNHILSEGARMSVESRSKRQQYCGGIFIGETLSRRRFCSFGGNSDFLTYENKVSIGHYNLVCRGVHAQGERPTRGNGMPWCVRKRCKKRN